jgi:hypothetical protein
MSKFIAFFLVALLILPALSSCRKVYDYIRDHPDAHDTLCRVTKLNVRGALGNEDEFTISYNAKGDPISILDSGPPNNNGNEDQYFRYDGHNRLTDFINTFIGTNVAFWWHKYAYPRKGFITDTVFEYTGRSDGPAPVASGPGLQSILGYTLDSRDRITKVWTLSLDPHEPPQFNRDVVYDANGNLPLSNPIFYYDDKVNVYRTNKVWQFVYQNYSRNNVLRPTTPDNPLYPPYPPPPPYNEFGLPLYLQTIAAPNVANFNESNINPTMVITYACPLPKGPINY